MRIYLPSTLPALAAVLEAGHAGAEDGPPLRAHAVTAALRAALGDDEEELEYEALHAAADASERRLAEDPAAPPRRVVLAADVPDDLVKPVDALGGDDPSAVELTGTVPFKRLASAHVDEEHPAEDPDARELLWFAPQELRYLF